LLDSTAADKVAVMPPAVERWPDKGKRIRRKKSVFLLKDAKIGPNSR
jgi:hypothetical protein